MSPENAKKVQNALDLIQAAQITLYDAAKELCSVVKFNNEYGKLCRHADATKALWHTVNDRKQSQ